MLGRRELGRRFLTLATRKRGRHGMHRIVEASGWAAGLLLVCCGETATNHNAPGGAPQSTSLGGSSMNAVSGSSTSSAGTAGGSNGGSQGGTAAETFLEERRDAGPFCIGNDDIYDACVPIDVSSGRPLQLFVHLGYPACSGAGCARCIGEPDLGCSATVSGNVIRLESWYSVNVEIGPIACDIEEPLVAECELPPLSEGSYVIQHGDVQVELNVPSESVIVCGYPQPENDLCCLSDAECEANYFCTDEFRCAQRRCEVSVDCGDGQVCEDEWCRLCSCPEGQTCGPNSTRCLRAKAAGPAYGACQADVDCQGALEQCEGDVCQQQCASSDECAVPESGNITPQCRLTSGVPGDCILPCSDSGAECPIGMRCGDYGYCVW